MAQNVTVAGNSFSAVPAVDLPKTGGGSARFFDTSEASELGPDDVYEGCVYFDDVGRNVGTMPNHSSDTLHPVIDDKDDVVSMGWGYWPSHDVQLDSTEKAKIIAKNIKSGITLLGVSGDSNVIDTELTGIQALSAMTDADLLRLKRGFVNGAEVVGSMPSIIPKTKKFSDVSDYSYTIPQGYHDGTGVVQIDPNEIAKVIAGNIKAGVSLLGVTGTYSGGGTLTVKTATTTKTSIGQTISFSSLSGQPKYWFLRTTTNVSSSGSTTYYYITDLFYDGTNIKGNTFRIGSTRRVQNITSGVTQSYSSNTLTITAGSVATATPGQFYGASGFGYELVYVY